MRPGQWKFGCGMVETGDGLPGVSVVAVLAVTAQLTLVRIERPMTASTIAGATAVINAAVAAGTLCPLVRAGKLKLSESVIEGGLVQLYQIIGTPFVIAVAALAGSGARRGKFAMKTSSACDVGCHALVAGQAFAVLRFFGKGRMARCAFCFEPGMCVG